MDGILLVDKPVGWTSFDVVAKVRGIIKAETGKKMKIGHTGTLDPMATGLMILVLGKYTKRAGEFSKLDKVYETELTLGQTSTTGDSEGEITQKSTNEPLLEDIEQTLSQFLGKIQQTPPTFSAIKVGGQRAYKLARAGKNIQLEAREVTIYGITDVKYDYPTLKITAKVSSGTYIRSLAKDIGAKLGIGAYLSHLRRISISHYSVIDALTIDKNTSYDIVKDVIQTPS